MSTTSTPINASELTGAILAGGQGSRMGNLDKGWVLYQDKPLIQHAIETLAPQVQQLTISANRHLSEYRKLGYPVISDDSPEFLGPLAGMLAMANAATTPWIITVPVDSPNIPRDYVETMCHHQHQSGADVVVACDGEYPQPVFLLFRAKDKPSMHRQLAAGDGKIMRWVRSQRFSRCVFSNKRIFENKNTPDDLKL